MGINLPQLGIDTQMSIDFTKSEIAKVSDRVNDVNIAQKTINTRGTKELLDSFTFPINVPSTSGTAATTLVKRTVTLKESILNYTNLNIQIGVKTNEVVQKSSSNNLVVKNIVFNNSETENLLDGSSIFCFYNYLNASAGAWGSGHFGFYGWFKDETHFFINVAVNPINLASYNTMILNSIQGVNIENVTIDPVSYINTTQGIEDAPVGHIMAYMGKTPPKHYLSCDGSVHNISEYLNLSQQIKQEFGSINFFGGDGITTFAVPDLRDEFLKGYHGEKVGGNSGEIGVHQEGTSIPGWYNNGYGTGIAIGLNASDVDRNPEINTVNNPKNTDKSEIGNHGYLQLNGTVNTAAKPIRSFISRPNNTAVLYCIKYEPTYYMSIEGLVEETTLFEGSVGTTSETSVPANINLTDSITNYDAIRVYQYFIYSGGSKHLNEREVSLSNLKYLIDTKPSLTTISLVFGYMQSTAYTNITSLSTYNTLNVNQNQTFVTKIVGIKYKTFQKGGTP